MDIKKAGRVFILIIASLLFVLPIIAVYNNLPGGLNFFKSVDTGAIDILYLFGRLFGLLAFTGIFIQIMTKTIRPLLEEFFGGDALHKYHTKQGMVVFLFAITHPILFALSGAVPLSRVFIPNYFSEIEAERFMALGTTALYLMILTVSAVIFSKYFGKWWHKIHMLNYLLFFMVLVHSYNLGSDVQSTFLGGLWWLYLVLVIFGIALRFGVFRRKNLFFGQNPIL